ncbi:MAG TPA: helix-turn-helix domain-containing protein [Candidatus Acidoferrales bacterium]|nr:helix-turn-helix domain-containing protein [Candidatus Acidoferrales bacterium]
MDLNCERAMGIIIPAIRISVSKRLKKEGMTQSEISKKLGIRQATVSKYLAGKYSAKLKKAERLVDAKGLSASISKIINQGRSAQQVADAMDAMAFRKEIVAAAIKIDSG